MDVNFESSDVYVTFGVPRVVRKLTGGGVFKGGEMGCSSIKGYMGQYRLN